MNAHGQVKRSLNRKTSVVALLALTSAMLLLATGCSTTLGEEANKRIADLEARIAGLEETIKDSLGTMADDGADEARKVYDDAKDYATYDGYLKDLEKRANEAIEKARGASVSSEASDKAGEFRKATVPLREIEDELGHLEDAFVSAHANGLVSSDELAKLEKHAEEVEGKIESSFDELKKTFGLSS